MPRKRPPNRELLLKLYNYNPKTGIFTHKRDAGRAKKGSTAGAIRSDGYINMFVGGKQWSAHHLAWYWFYGHWPCYLDHKNRMRADNRIENLRECSPAQNNMNSDGWDLGKRKHKLPRGVYHRSPKLYRAMIMVDRKHIHLGYFKSVKEAEAAYKSAAKRHFGEFAI